MRLEQYLKEEYFDTTKYSHREIFKNPTKREMRDILAMGDAYGFRLFIDLKKKNVYMANAEIFHKSMLDTSDNLNKELGNLNWYGYWSAETKANEYLLMGSCDSKMKHFISDALDDISREADTDNLATVKKLTEWDYKWLSKYGFNPKEVKDAVWNYVIWFEERAEIA